jgi:hypothetical protein
MKLAALAILLHHIHLHRATPAAIRDQQVELSSKEKDN